MKRLILSVLYCLVMRSFLKVIVGVVYRNREAIKKVPQFVLVANHNSHLDTMALMSACSPGMIAKTHPIAAGDYFGQSPIRAFFTRFFVNAILIPRSRPKQGEGGPDPIELMSEQLDKGHSLILFPEGSRGEPEKFQKFKRGIGILLDRHPGVHYIPVFMKGLGKSLPKGETLLVPFNSLVILGDPRKCESRDIDGIVQEVEAAIRALSLEAH